MKSLADMNVTIIGLGLMGGSLAWALKPHCNRVIGIDKNDSSIQTALAKNIIDHGTDEIDHAIPGSDIFIIATPVNEIVKIIRSYGNKLPRNCLVLDIGSTKKNIVREMLSLPSHIQAIGTHPMCGKERSGIDAADPNLYKDKTFILTPLPNTNSDTLDFVKYMINCIGGKTITLDAEYQDFLVAFTSHLPYINASGLMNIAIDLEKEHSEIWNVAASGFVDSTRLASSDIKMITDILFSNRNNILQGIELMKKQLDEYADIIKQNDEEKLQSILSNIKHHRDRLFK